MDEEKKGVPAGSRKPAVQKSKKMASTMPKSQTRKANSTLARKKMLSKSGSDKFKEALFVIQWCGHLLTIR